MPVAYRRLLPLSITKRLNPRLQRDGG